MSDACGANQCGGAAKPRIGSTPDPQGPKEVR
jgi:hypothetical protein